MYGIDFHADDYAASVGNSKRILELLRAGRIDSLSVITNMGCYEECMKLLRDNWDLFPKKPLLSVHINLIDGYRLSCPESGEIINNSWAKIFICGLPFVRKKGSLRSDFTTEIEAQIRVFLKETENLRDENGDRVALRIDSHVHTHMIPLVFQAVEDALERMGLLHQVSFIRCSTEPLLMFLFTPGVAGTVSPVNILKNLTLHFFSHFVRNRLRSLGIETGRIFGLAMTGEMDLKRVSLLMPKMKEYAQKKNAYLEVLSHPGRVDREEISEEYGPDDRTVFISPRRDVEFRMLMEIRREGDSSAHKAGGEG